MGNIFPATIIPRTFKITLGSLNSKEFKRSNLDDDPMVMKRVFGNAFACHRWENKGCGCMTLLVRVSTVGMKASGMSNMKFAMNGCIQIGTYNGANDELREQVGENLILYGVEAHEIVGLRKERSEGKFVFDPHFEEVKKYARSGVFGPYSYNELMGSLEGGEGYGCADCVLLGKYIPAYSECQDDQVDKAYRDHKLNNHPLEP